MYSQDFATSDAVFEPAQEALLLGVPPLLLLFGLALLAAAGLFGWWLGRRPRKQAVSAASAIWKAVDDAIRATMTAHSDALADRAATLRRTVHDRLGATLTLTGGLSPLDALDKALKGPPAHTAHDDHTDGHGPGHGHDEHAAHDGDHPDEPEAPSTPGVLIEHADRVVIHQPAAPREERRPTPPPPSPPTEAQRRDAIRKAVSDLNDHWRLRDARIAEIEAAHRELSAAR
jgi:hypothetical protein